MFSTKWHHSMNRRIGWQLQIGDNPELEIEWFRWPFRQWDISYDTFDPNSFQGGEWRTRALSIGLGTRTLDIRLHERRAVRCNSYVYYRRTLGYSVLKSLRRARSWR